MNLQCATKKRRIYKIHLSPCLRVKSFLRRRSQGSKQHNCKQIRLACKTLKKGLNSAKKVSSTLSSAKLTERKVKKRENWKRKNNIKWAKNGHYTNSVFPMMHLICPPKFCITFVFHFSWVLQPPQEKLKTTLMRNFGEQIRCIMGNIGVAYRIEHGLN